MKTRILAAAVVLVAAGAASADTVDLKFVGTGQGKNVSVNGGSGWFHVFAGQLMHSFKNGTGAGAEFNGQTHVTYCNDLHQYVTSNTKTYTLVDIKDMPAGAPMGLAKAQAIKDIYAYADGAQVSAGADANFAAAFQIAVWEIVKDYDAGVGNASLNVNAGQFRARSTGGGSLASGITMALNNLFAAVGSNANFSAIVGLASNKYQDQMVLRQIPLPSAGAMGLAGLALIAARRRRG